jgi:hypothetical protein
VALVATIQHRLELPPVALRDLAPDGVGGPIGATRQHASFDRPAEQLRQRQRSGEDDVGGQLDLGHAVAVAQVDGRPLGRAEPGRELGRPVVAALPEHGRRHRIGRGLQRHQIAHAQDRVVLLVDCYPGTVQPLTDEVVAIQVAGDREGQIRRDPQAHRPHHRVPDVPGHVQEPLPTGLDPPVVRVAAPWRPLRRVRDERPAGLKAGEHAGDALPRAQPPVVRPDQLLLAPPSARPAPGCPAPG